MIFRLRIALYSCFLSYCFNSSCSCERFVPVRSQVRVFCLNKKQAKKLEKNNRNNNNNNVCLLFLTSVQSNWFRRWCKRHCPEFEYLEYFRFEGKRKKIKIEKKQILIRKFVIVHCTCMEYTYITYPDGKRRRGRGRETLKLGESSSKLASTLLLTIFGIQLIHFILKS